MYLAMGGAAQNMSAADMAAVDDELESRGVQYLVQTRREVALKKSVLNTVGDERRCKMSSK